jgi:hypothetical protein
MRSALVASFMLVLASLALGACGGHRPSTVAAGGDPARSIEHKAGSACPVTLPRPWTPPPGVTFEALFGADSAYGNGKLWVGGLWPRGVIAAGPAFLDNGFVSMKFGWWRTIRGYLRISGRRLDGPAPPLRAVVGNFGLTGFQASGVTFPVEGCWRVTGAAGTTRLTFVTLVTKKG